MIVDTLRADHVYGNRAKTPNIDELMRQGLSFTRFYPEAMPTIPARRSILSGRRVFPFHGWHPYKGLLHEPGWAPLGNVSAAFTSVLRRNGYWTAYVTDNTGVGFSPPWKRFRRSVDSFVRRGGQYGGTDRGVSERELRHWLPPQLEDAETRDRIRRYLANGQYAHDETKSFAARVFSDGSRVLETAKRQQPFAMVVDTFEPHEPWTPPRKYVDMYGDPDYRGPEPARPYYAPVSHYLSAGEARVLLARMRALYAAEVTMTDRWLGIFLDKLDALKLERETVVMLVSDHGFFLGDHGLTGKIATRLHPELIHVPLIVVHPERRRRGDRSRYFASDPRRGAHAALDGRRARAPRGMDGVDLSRFFSGRRPPERDYAWGGYGNSFFVKTDRWSMFGDNRGGGFHLYNPRRDFREYRDVAGSHRGKARELYGVVRRRGGHLPYFPY